MPGRLAARSGWYSGWSPCMKWDHEHYKMALAWYEEGRSHREIMKLLNEKFKTNYTRNAVLGKLSRSGKKRDSVERTFARSAGGRLNGSANMFQINTSGMAQKPSAPRPLVTKPVFDAPIDVARPLALGLPKERPHNGPVYTLEEIGPSQCHYPIGDPAKDGFGYCGEPKRCESSYCSTHHSIVWKPAPPPREPKGARAGTTINRRDRH